MQLIGMLDSPYVRRVAIALQLLELRFKHNPLSVFRTFDQFSAINPVVKAPTLVCDDGTVLMDSTLILEYAQALAGPRRRLLPDAVPELQHALRLEGLALAACEKSVQIVYEQQLRPTEKQHAPWIDRVTAQTLAAYGALEQEVARRAPSTAQNAIDRAGVAAAVAWHFTQALLPGLVDPRQHPALAALSACAEALPEFQAAPHGDGTCRAPA